MSSSEPTRVDNWLQAVKNHKVLSLVIIFGVVLIGLGTAANAVLDLKKLFFGESQTAAPPITSVSETKQLGAEQAGIAIALHSVAFDDKGDVVAATEFTSKSANLDEGVYGDIADWLARELKLVTDHPDVTVAVNVQSDWRKAKPSLSREPDGPAEYFLRYVATDASDSRGGDKIRVPISSQSDSLAAIPDDVSRCELEIRVPGYGSQVVDIVRGEDFKEALSFTPNRLRIGVEALKGPMPEGSDRIAVALAKHPRIDVVSPNALDRIREEIKEHNRRIDERPEIQDVYRDLSVDYILAGSVYVNK